MQFKTLTTLAMAAAMLTGGCAMGGLAEGDRTAAELTLLADELTADVAEGADVVDGSMEITPELADAARESVLAGLEPLRERFESALEQERLAASLGDDASGRGSAGLTGERPDLIVVGDSVSAGANPQRGGYGWVEALQERHPEREIINLAIGGTTAAGWSGQDPSLLARLDGAIAAHPKVMVVYLGGNDALTYEAFVDDGVVDAQSLGAAVQGVLTIVGRVRVRSPETRIVVGTYYDLFDGLSPFVPSRFSMYGYPGTRFRSMSYNTLVVNLAIYGVAYLTGSEVVDPYDNFLGHGYAMILLARAQPAYFQAFPTDVHPNTAGHRALSREFETHLGY